MIKQPRRVAKAILFLLAALECAHAQTQIDLSAQTKNVDFSAAPSTKPVQVVETLPALCSKGQIVFWTMAAPGQNLYLCTANNTWSPISSNVQGVNGGTVTYVAGTGIILFLSAVNGTNLLQVNVDTAWIQSRAIAQASYSTFCKSTTGTTDYNCYLSPTLSAYSGPSSTPPGSTCLVLYVDTASTTTATLNVDTLGVIPILGRSGGALNPGDIPAKTPVIVCFNDTAFLLQR